MKTQKERDAAKRDEKIAHMQEQIDQGKLTVRKMTAKERAAHPPKPRTEKPRRGRR